MQFTKQYIKVGPFVYNNRPNMQGVQVKLSIGKLSFAVQNQQHTYVAGCWLQFARYGARAGIALSFSKLSYRVHMYTYC